jgi:hypothetical protein
MYAGCGYLILQTIQDLSLLDVDVKSLWDYMLFHEGYKLTVD